MYKCLVAVNDMDAIRSFEEIVSTKLRKRAWSKMIAYSLSKHNQTRDLSSETIQNWLESIESFAHNDASFGLFKTTEGGYLLSDGCVLSTVNPHEFSKSKHKYYALWKIDPVKGYLVHYLSGKCVAAVHPDSAKGTHSNQQFRQHGISIVSNPTEHPRVLQLFDSTRFSREEPQFVRIDGDNQMRMSIKNESIIIEAMLVVIVSEEDSIMETHGFNISRWMIMNATQRQCLCDQYEASVFSF